MAEVLLDDGATVRQAASVPATGEIAMASQAASFLAATAGDALVSDGFARLRAGTYVSAKMGEVSWVAFSLAASKTSVAKTYLINIGLSIMYRDCEKFFRAVAETLSSPVDHHFFCPISLNALYAMRNPGAFDTSFHLDEPALFAQRFSAAYREEIRPFIERLSSTKEFLREMDANPQGQIASHLLGRYGGLISLGLAQGDRPRAIRVAEEFVALCRSSEWRRNMLPYAVEFARMAKHA